jgi:kynurenine formamidase
VRRLNSESAAGVEDLQAALAGTGHTLQPGDIVLVQTGNDQYWGRREYYDRGPGVSAEATRWLIDEGVRLMGIDAWGWDRPLAQQARDARQSGRNDVFWAAHYVGVDHEYCQIERLANLNALPATGFTVCAFPLKVKGGSAGPARVVAMIDG